MPAIRRAPGVVRPLPYRARVCVLLAGTCLLALPGCDVSIKDGDLSVGMLNAEAKEEWDRQYPLSQGGRVEIVNVNGPIELKAGESGEVVVHATRTAKALTDADAKAFLALGKIDESAAPDSIRIATLPVRRIRGSYEVSYAVSVPADARVTLSVTNGHIHATGISGTLKASVVNGGVEASDMSGEIDSSAVNGTLTCTLKEVTGGVRLETTNGRIALRLPAAAGAVVSARVVNGGINVEGFKGVDEPQRGRRTRTLDTTLNGGGPEIRLRTTNGRINITATP